MNHGDFSRFVDRTCAEIEQNCVDRLRGQNLSAARVTHCVNGTNAVCRRDTRFASPRLASFVARFVRIAVSTLRFRLSPRHLRVASSRNVALLAATWRCASVRNHDAAWLAVAAAVADRRQHDRVTFTQSGAVTAMVDEARAVPSSPPCAPPALWRRTARCATRSQTLRRPVTRRRRRAAAPPSRR